MDGFSQRIKELRKKYGYTQAKLGEMLGISASAVGMYEQGRREPDSRILTEMSRVFSVPVDYLLSGDDSGPREIADELADLRARLKVTGGLMLNGNLLDEQDTEKLFDAMMLAANLMFKESDRP